MAGERADKASPVRNGCMGRTVKFGAPGQAAEKEKPAIRSREGRETNGAVLLAGWVILAQLLLLCNINVLQVGGRYARRGFRRGSGAD